VKRRDYVQNINNKVNAKLDLMGLFVYGMRVLQLAKFSLDAVHLLVKIILENHVNLLMIFVPSVRSIIVALKRLLNVLR